mgnify:CR=1 FL=1
MTNRNLFVKTVVLDSNKSVFQQTKNLLRGQWVFINGMMARVANNAGGVAVLMMHRDKMLAVFR